MDPQIIEKHGRSWMVREARSEQDALNAIAHAAVSGSIANRVTLTSDEKLIVLADVVQIDNDGAERKAYAAPDPDSRGMQCYVCKTWQMHTSGGFCAACVTAFKVPDIRAAPAVPA